MTRYWVAYRGQDRRNPLLDPEFILAYEGDIFPVAEVVDGVDHVRLRWGDKLWPMPGDYTLSGFKPIPREYVEGDRKLRKRIVVR